MKKTVSLALALSLSTSLFAMSSIDKKIINYETKMIKQNPAYTLHSIKLERKKALDSNGKWNAYNLKLDLTQKSNQNRFDAPLIVFSNGKYITNDLREISTGKRYGEDEQKAKNAKERKEFEKNFTLPNSYYKKDHLIAGNHNAKNKVVLFSDPLCVFCIQLVPNIIEGIKRKKDIALYYYDFPLSMHPTAKTVIKAMIKAKEDGIKDVELKIYTANYEKFYDVYRTKNSNKALSVFNKILNTKYKLSDINTPNIQQHLKEDINAGIKANVQGTPAIVVNGSYLNSRTKLRNLLDM